MTKHKKEGIFPMSEKMPCQPRHIVIKDPYMLPVVFDNNLEAEEAAARIIFFSQRKHRWVGVAWQRLLATMKEDIAANDLRFALRERARQEHRWTEYQKRWYHSLCAPLRRFCPWFFPARLKEPTVPTSGVYSYGLSFVRHGLRFLVSGGWLRTERHDDNVVYFPTSKLIKRIMRKYGIIAK